MAARAVPILAAEQKEVVVLGTLHGDHNRFPLYNLETLRIAIAHIKPDLLIIEETPEAFQGKWYETLSEEEYGRRRPIEIRKVLMPYALKAGVKVVPVDDREEYDARSKALDANMNPKLKDPAHRTAVETVLQGYGSLFLDDYLTKSIYDFQSDTYMAVIDQYQMLARQNPLTKVRQELSDRRQAKIDANIIRTLDKEIFTRAVIVYGVTHRPSIVRAVRKGRVAKLLALDEAMKPMVAGFFDRDRSPLLGD